jgi:hypothetical protein
MVNVRRVRVQGRSQYYWKLGLLVSGSEETGNQVHSYQNSWTLRWESSSRSWIVLYGC